MYELKYMSGGVRKSKTANDFEKIISEAINKDSMGDILLSVDKVNREGKPINRVWEISDTESSADAIKRLKALLATT